MIRTDRIRSIVLAAGVAAPFVLGAGAAAAQSDWKAEWDKTVAAAKQEGEVLIAATQNPIVRRVVEKLWPAAYPDIKLKPTVISGAWGRRVKEERAIGKFLWDVYLAGAAPYAYAVAQEVIDPLVPALILPDVKDPKTWGGWEAAFADRTDSRLLAFANFTGTIWYNADIVPKAEADRLAFKILLKPEYKGKIAWWDPRTGQGAGTTYAHLIYRVEGWDTLKKIVVDQESQFFNDAQAATEAIVRGKAVFSIGANLDNRLQQFRDAGLKLNIEPLGRTPQAAHLAYGGTSIGIMNKAPHPNAAKVFINWFLTKEVQSELLPQLRHNSRRVDLPIFTNEWIAAIPGKKYNELQNERHVAERLEVTNKIKQLRP
jgi:iron(III) transport system substrate-binding protein